MDGDMNDTNSLIGMIPFLIIIGLMLILVFKKTSDYLRERKSRNTFLKHYKESGGLPYISKIRWSNKEDTESSWEDRQQKNENCRNTARYKTKSEIGYCYE